MALSAFAIALHPIYSQDAESNVKLCNKVKPGDAFVVLICQNHVHQEGAGDKI
jgi:hypothetical protein